MRLETRRPLPTPIPAAALANLALLLAVFFVLVSLAGTSTGSLDLPVASSPLVSALGSACVVIERHLDPTSIESIGYALSDGRGSVTSLPSLDALYLEASRLSDEDPHRAFLVKADARVRYAVVDDVLETLRRAGAESVVFWTRATGSDGAP